MYATTLNSLENTVTYAIWITHRDNWAEVGQPFLDRDAVIKYIKAKQEEAGLEFVKIKQAVELIHDEDAADLSIQNSAHAGSVGLGL
eukprot:scaffold898_cov179-Ochromonas_danica.AAC.1